MDSNEAPNAEAICTLPTGGELTGKWPRSQCCEQDSPVPGHCLGYGFKERKTHINTCRAWKLVIMYV